MRNGSTEYLEKAVADLRAEIAHLRGSETNRATAVPHLARIVEQVRDLARRDGWADRDWHQKEMELLLAALGQAATWVVREGATLEADEESVEDLAVGLVGIGGDLICNLPEQGSDVRIPVLTGIRALLQEVGEESSAYTSTKTAARKRLTDCNPELRATLRGFYGRIFNAL